ncbi:MAG TPA: BTAD domain-containing putative transcriptional regulator [Burkholderiaceae bacterium]|nr:BTAD domain-containing putative transcriptional regulator [Burkholderiaceae bacterium]
MELDNTNTGSARIELVGVPRLVLAGDARELERKDAALLALLAIEGPTARARAAGLLWPDVDDDAARNNLRQRLHRLRKRAGRDLVLARQDVLRLADDVGRDVPRDLTRAGDGGASGDLLGTLMYDDCSDLNDWVAAARARHRTAHRDALAAAAARFEHEGRIAQALRLAEQLLIEDPLLEHAHRRVMRLHYLRGDRAAALAAFQRCRDVLARELAAAPGKETIGLAALIEASGRLATATAAPTPVAVLRPPRLVGRAIEWRALEQSWWERYPTLVSGEAGIGKSRLLSEFAAAHGGIVIGARPGDGHVPYALLARVLRALHAHGGVTRETWAQRELARIVPEFDPEWTAIGDVNAARLAQAVELQLAVALGADGGADGQRLRGIVLDDLQFADAESVGVLSVIVRAEGLALAWIFGARGHEVPAVAQPWRSAMDALALRQLGLAPLDASGTLELMRSLELVDVDAAGWAKDVYRHTGGNPMFVLETLAALLAADVSLRTARATAGARLPIPDSVGQLIEARLTKLSAPALKLARVAALADKDFSIGLAAAVLGVHALDLAEPWRELAQAQIVRDEGFAHDLVLEATRRSIPTALTQLIHRTIATCLERQAGAPERIADHWRSANAWAKARDAYLLAAERALARSRRAEELLLLRNAADCLAQCENDAVETHDGDIAATRFEIDLRSARASLLIDRADEARRFAHRALERAHGDLQRATALAACAETEEFLGEFDAAIEHASEGLRVAQTLGDASLVLTHAALLGKVLATRGEFDRGRAMFEAHALQVQAAGSAAAARAFFMHQAIVLDQARRRDEAVTAGLKALQLAHEAHDESSACLCHIHLTSFYARLGAGADAFEHAQRAVQLRERVGQAGGQTEVAELYLGVLCNSLGRFGQTLQLLDTAQQRLVLGRAVSWAVMARGVLARTWLVLGQPARGLRLLADEIDGVTDSVRGLRLVNLVRVLRALGKPHARELAEAHALFARQAQHEGDLLVQLEQAVDAPPSEGAALAAAVEAAADARMHRSLQLDAQVIGCAALLASGAIDRAAEKARATLRFAANSITWTVYRAEIWWRAHEALAAAGAQDEALAALRDGVAWIDAILPNAPDECHDSFLDRNAVNRAILTTASRKLRSDRAGSVLGRR